jgi:hypothetical protein
LKTNANTLVFDLSLSRGMLMHWLENKK